MCIRDRIRRLYGIHEKQFRKYFKEADRRKGVTGTNLLLLLEQRLDNIVYRMGFASSRNEGRQAVVHGHFLINGKRVDRPSYQPKVGDVISIKDKSKEVTRFQMAVDAVERRGTPTWIDLDKTNFSGTIKALPNREELTMPMQEQLVVELYSK